MHLHPAGQVNYIAYDSSIYFIWSTSKTLLVILAYLILFSYLVMQHQQSFFFFFFKERMFSRTIRGARTEEKLLGQILNNTSQQTPDLQRKWIYGSLDEVERDLKTERCKHIKIIFHTLPRSWLKFHGLSQGKNGGGEGRCGLPDSSEFCSV